MAERALIILVGVTANRAKCADLDAFFARAEEYDVFIPPLPQRQGLANCVPWFRRYLTETVAPRRYRRVDYLNYISGGFIFRHAAEALGAGNTGRLVFVRGPVQELVPARLVARLGRFLTRLLFGRMVLDLTTADLSLPKLPDGVGERGLIIEKGVSRMARLLGLGPDDPPVAAWEPERLLPGASDWRTVAESHDDTYTSPKVLTLVLGFLRDGRFPEAG